MKKIIWFISLWLVVSSCRTTMPYSFVEHGDLIFVESNEKNLSGAISRVTKDNAISISYDHMGLIEKNGNRIYVLHATTQGGSKKESLQDFIASQGERRLVIYRLKNAYKSAIPKAMEKANNMLGKPYNFLYIPNDSSYYCSDFVQRAFAKDSIFKLEPMTFINPKTGKTDAYWASFYQQYNVEVPEGLPGCNPNEMSKSNKIKEVFIIK